MRTCMLSTVVATVCLSIATTTWADEAAKPRAEATLRLFNTGIFGKSATEPVVLLAAPREGAVDPETVMVDIDKGVYYAATVNYPKTVDFESARRSLNAAYGRWEKPYFAHDPNMGIWRNEDEKFSIQLTADEDNITVCYVHFTLVTDELIGRALKRAFPELENGETEEPPESSQ